jgi:DNA-binding NarL/FixJ family response regulator
VVRVFIVARSAAEQERLRSRAASTDIAVVGVAARPELAAAARPEVAIVADADLVGGAEAAAAPRVVVWTDNEDAPRRIRQWRLASWGIVGRDATPQQLQAAVLAVASGLCVAPPEALTAATGVEADDTREEDADGLALEEALTPRERDVLDLASRGLSNREIAAALGISEHTVKFHLASIYGKLGVSTRTAAVRRGLRRGIITI